MSCTSCSTNNGLPKGCKNNGSCGVDGCGKLTVFDWLADIQLPSHQEPYNIVEVQFKNDRKAYYINSSQLPIQIGDCVMVESSPGIDAGRVTLTGELVKVQMKIKKIRKDSIAKLIRKANENDIEKWNAQKDKEENTLIQSRKIANNLKLSMKISDVEYQADGAKITFYYTAEGRVDFRLLIKEYATVFKAKIDMRQIGYRQETAKIGGIGSCGRELCCSSWLTDFRSVNTGAARYQQLSINPQKLAGQCGKLKCCLNYELDSYLDTLNSFPPQNVVLLTEKGKAQCVKIDVFRKRMSFMYVDNSFNWFEFSTEQVHGFIQENKKGSAILPLEDLINESAKPVRVDLIEENSLNRFERKKNPRHKNKKPKSNNHPHSKTKVGDSNKNTSTQNQFKRKSPNKPNPNGNNKK